MFIGPIKGDTAANLKQFVKMQNLEVRSFIWTIQKFKCTEAIHNSVCDWMVSQVDRNNWEGTKCMWTVQILYI